MDLTFTEQIVITYFEKHPKKLLSATIRELAAITCTSTGSIERAVKKLGYENFSHYRYTLKAIKNAEKRFVTQFHVTKDVKIEHRISQFNPQSVAVTMLFRFTGRNYQARTNLFFDALKSKITDCRLGLADPTKKQYLSPA